MFIDLSNNPITNPSKIAILLDKVEWIGECVRGLQGQKLGQWIVNHSDVWKVNTPFEIEHCGIKFHFDPDNYIAIDTSYKNQTEHTDTIIVGISRCYYDSHDGETY